MSELRSSTPAASFDVLIVGGGPAGAATALALARRGLRAAIIERSAAPRPRVGETLPPAVRNPLQSLGAWERFLDDGHEPAVGNRSSWGSDGVDELHFIRNVHGHGWHIDRQKFEVMLLELAREAGATVVAGAPIDAWEHRDAGHLATVARRQLHAPVAVDATGRASFLARILGADRVAIDQLVAATLFLHPRVADPQQQFTLIEAMEDGWWYSAPLPDRRLVAAFMTDGDLEACRRVRTRAGWLETARRTRTTGARIEAYSIGEALPRIASASTSRLTAVTGPGWLAVGDAAASFDPLSSQGLMTALESALEAAAAIAEGIPAAWSRYASVVTGRYRAYLVERAHFYSVERRWSHMPFWSRRHQHLHAHAS